MAAINHELSGRQIGKIGVPRRSAFILATAKAEKLEADEHQEAVGGVGYFLVDVEESSALVADDFL